MDNLTHSLAGLLLSRAGLDRLTPRAAPILLLAANAPDIDVVTALGGSLNYLHYHRHITHSVVALSLLPLVCVAVVRLVSRKPVNWLGGYVIALIGVISHLLFDLTNIYGIRLLAPFSGRWFRLDITSVVDFWIWGALFLAVFAPMLSRMVNAEIGASAGKRGGAYRGFAVAALVFIVLYNGARYVVHERVVATLDSRVYSGAAPSRVGAFPSAASLVRWRGVAETAAVVSVQDVDVTTDFDPGGGRLYYKPEPSPALEAAGSTPLFQEFLRFSQFPLYQVTPAEQSANATRVEAMDLRFGDPQAPGFVATAIVDSQLRVERAWFQFGGPRPR